MLEDNRKKLRELIITHEGTSTVAYQDTLGIWTIGCGRNIDKKHGGGLRDNEIEFLLDNDIEDRMNALSLLSLYQSLNDVRKGVLVELAFQIGYEGFLKFKKFIAALEKKDYKLAVKELLDSLWAQQTGPARVKSLCDRIISGVYAS